MITLILILSVLNFGGLLTAGVLYFKNKYTIVSIEQWNEIAQVYNTLAEKDLLDCIDDLTPNRELTGGCGDFFRDALYEEENEEA